MWRAKDESHRISLRPGYSARSLQHSSEQVKPSHTAAASQPRSVSTSAVERQAPGVPRINATSPPNCAQLICSEAQLASKGTVSGLMDPQHRGKSAAQTPPTARGSMRQQCSAPPRVLRTFASSILNCGEVLPLVCRARSARYVHKVLIRFPDRADLDRIPRTPRKGKVRAKKWIEPARGQCTASTKSARSPLEKRIPYVNTL